MSTTTNAVYFRESREVGVVKRPKKTRGEEVEMTDDR